jgi:hypothetical protein
MLPELQQRIVGLGLLGLGVYFTIELVRGLLSYQRYRRIRPTALVTWPAPRPPQATWLLGLGVLGGLLAVLNGWLQRPLYHVYGLAVMSAYFLIMVPLALRIRPGLYRDGVWADAGFIRWDRVARIAFVETPHIVLLLLPRRGRRSFRLLVPPGEYGEVRKQLQEVARSGTLQLDPSILGL